VEAFVAAKMPVKCLSKAHKMPLNPRDSDSSGTCLGFLYKWECFYLRARQVQAQPWVVLGQPFAGRAKPNGDGNFKVAWVEFSTLG